MQIRISFYLTGSPKFYGLLPVTSAKKPKSNL